MNFAKADVLATQHGQLVSSSFLLFYVIFVSKKKPFKPHLSLQAEQRSRNAVCVS
jgi:hypothetical protein